MSKGTSVVLSEMTYPERLEFFATGNVTTKEIQVVADRSIESYHVAKVRGYPLGHVDSDGVGRSYKFQDAAAAKVYGHQFIDECKAEILTRKKRGLDH